MKLNVLFREESGIHVNLLRDSSTFFSDFGTVQSITTETDYNKLTNKPSINGHTLQGDISSDDLDIAAGFPEEGSIGDILMKTGASSRNVSWVTPASNAEADNTRPITAAAVYMEIGNINALLATI